MCRCEREGHGDPVFRGEIEFVTVFLQYLFLLNCSSASEFTLKCHF